MTDLDEFRTPITPEQATRATNRTARGWWNMACWNALSEDQQRTLIEVGVLPLGYIPAGEKCDRPAVLTIETKYDEAPGPRFYCIPCAIEYLQGLNHE